MKIYSMTATFGKLERSTLTLEPGLNIIEAPNEWGKSTWCAFLCAMFYGIETRVHSKKSALADKEHYAPWSGSPMAGSMDICWEGREITIERSSKGRIPFAGFRAYETQTGLPVPGLTAENCGERLLGVDKEVFLRSAFLRLTDLPVTQSDSLRRRLNALVTTGDESGAAEALATKLGKLKNTIRSNSRSGLLPQAEAERDQVKSRLDAIHALQQQVDRLEQRTGELETHRARLLNHKKALEYARAAASHARLEEARREEARLQSLVAELEAQCACLPSREDLEQAKRQADKLLQQQSSLYMEAAMAPGAPEAPESPFPETDPDRLDARIELDRKAQSECLAVLSKKHRPLWPWGLGLTLLGGCCCFLSVIAGGIMALLGLVLLSTGFVREKNLKKQQLKHRLVLTDLASWYGSGDPTRWKAGADQYRRQLEEYEASLARFRREYAQRMDRFEALRQQLHALTGGKPGETFLEEVTRELRLWEELDRTRREWMRAQTFTRSLETAAPPAAPAVEDTLTYTEDETNRLLSDCDRDLRQLQSELGSCRGRMEALGDPIALLRQLQSLELRIRKLKDTLNAIDLSQRTLSEATEALQRRFAPRLTRRAEQLFSRLTGGRYGRLTMDRELTLLSAAGDEEVLRSVLWRSDGTADQLYLALRLALWEELTPHSPLILDDALVRFDDDRLKAALEVLQELSREKQILLFTCQGRENRLISR